MTEELHHDHINLDRVLQSRILEHLAGIAPNGLSEEDQERFAAEAGSDERLAAHLLYLDGHGLVRSGIRQMDGGYMWGEYPTITSQGIDFLMQDGGLSAVLNCLTVKLHEDTLLALLEKKILESDTSPEEKNRLVQAVKGLSGEAIKHLTMRVLDVGFDHVPSLIPLIGKFLKPE